MRVVIIGGGFGGVAAAQALAKTAVEVTLIDRRNHYLCQPLLYQVATGSLGSGDIAEPLRALFHRQGNVDVLLGEVTAIDVHAQTVRVRGIDDPPVEPRAIAYDYLIVAAGAGPS